MKPVESFIEQPVRSLQTMLRVISINNSNSVPIIPDGIYGQSTLNSVAEYQNANKLPVTGITDQQTWDAIYEEYEDALTHITPAEPIEVILDPGEKFTIGTIGPYVYLLQSMLIFLSDQHATIHAPRHTGIYDEDTRLAVLDLQGLSSLPQTGDTDRITWKHIVKQFALNAHHYNLLRKEKDDD